MSSDLQTLCHDHWASQDNDIYQCKDLIYLRTLKNASTYYSTVVKKNNWKEIEFNDIDWNQHTVFSFIRNPKMRYYSGLVEDILADPEILVSIMALAKSTRSVVFTLHSTPLSIELGDYVHKIKWIPIDINYANGVNPEQMFFDLCAHHDIDINWDIGSIPANRLNTNDAKIKIYEQLMSLVESKQFSLFNNNNQIFNKLFAKDIDLYNTVCSNHTRYFNPVTPIFNT